VGDTGTLSALSARTEKALGVPPFIRVNGKAARDAEWNVGPFEDPARWRKRLFRYKGNIGLVCGHGILALDFDLYKPDGAVTYQLLDDAGLVPADTVRAHTGGGGLHVLLRYDPGEWHVGCGDLKDRTLSDGTRLPGGGEFKGEGGYVVVAPSIHPDTGLAYVWEDGCAPGEIPVAASAIELLSVLGHRIQGDSYSRGPGGWKAWSPGALDQTSDEAMILLLEHFDAHSPITHFEREPPWGSVTRPGKRPDGGTSATVGYVAPGLVKVWSTNWPGLGERPYTLKDLRVLAALEEPERIHVHEVDQIEFTSIQEARSRGSMWLWEDRIPAGQFVIAAGIEKLGKSTALVWVCSKLTTGELPGDFERRPLTVAYISAEDAGPEVLKPRFQAAGADPDRVWILTPGGIFSVEVLKRLEPRPDVLILDPISSFINLRVGANEHGEIAVRQALAPFHELAVNEGVTVIGIRHGRKSGPGDNPLDMVLGSKAWTAAARALLIFAPDREHGDRPGGLIFGRGNLAAPSSGLRYRLDQVPVVYDEAVVRPSTGELVTEGLANLFVPEGTASITLDEALGPKSQATERVNAEAFLLAQLVDGEEHLASELLTLAEDAGIALRTLQNARSKLRLLVRREGFGRGSKVWWKLPAENA
jgi:hypothetical protein